MSSRQIPDYIRQLLPSGQGQGDGGMQTQQQQQQLKALIISLGGVPQTSNIQQLKKLLKKTQRIHNLKKIIPSIQEDTITYLISKGLNDSQIEDIGKNFPEEDINFMVECVPVLKNKRDFLDNLLHHGVKAFIQLILKNKSVVETSQKLQIFLVGRS